MDINKLASLGDADEVVVTGAEVKALADQVTKAAVEKAAHEQANNAQPTPVVIVGRSGEDEAKKAKAIGAYIVAGIDKDFSRQENILKENVNILGVTKANFIEGTDGSGGYLVPTAWYNDIFSNVGKYGYARRLAKTFPMSAKTHKLNRGGAIAAAMTSEESAPTPLDSTSFFAQTELTARRASAAFLVSRELLKDAPPAFIEYMNRELGQGLAKLEDQQFFKGDANAPNHRGLVNVSGVNVAYFGGASNSGKDTIAEITWSDLMRVIIANNSTILSNGIFVMPQSVFYYLMKETDGVSGRPIWNMAAPLAAANMVGLEGLNAQWTPLGRPAVVVPDDLFPTTAVTTTHVIFGDFSQYSIFGELEGAELRTFNESYNGTALSGVNRQAIEISERFGIAFPQPDAFTLIKTSTT